MKPTVYIETTIAGHLTSRLPKNAVVAAQMLLTRQWWTESRPHFECFTSVIVLDEAASGDPQAAVERLEAMSTVTLVPVTEAAIELANLLLARGALPARARVNASHVAIAATNGMQFLLKWNCKHLGNPALRARIESACRDSGFEPPTICTPAELDEVQS